ncbi:cytochrome b5 [Annulohypoxylon truncatum]|uniref:cytochrome b5 n=1 Tax=Annulohypoxylon truncatum TaxID=327061 RepID=UPI002008BF0F|nr:cytochrome b5 [Annulohypoxylon truncatum]KAI1210482.1 cytochrome b5 [Annulohypoxylon truncatum]
MAEIRQRKGKGPAKDESYRTAIVEELDTSESDTPAPPKPKPSVKELVTDEEEYSPWVDILRVISFLIVASCGLSYLVSGGESFTWNMRAPPKYMQLDWWKTQLRGPIYLTPAELAQYDGTDETKPIYLAINGTIFDVSSNRRTYGPGGSYRFFAGADAARSYITGCFADDRTADLRGVEEMFLPLDDPAVDAHFDAAELAALKEQELKEAQEKAHEALAHWIRFFEASPKYSKVGYVKKDKNWLDREPRRKLCESASKGRKPRKIPGTEE